MKQLYAGTIAGTSLDGIDIAVVEFGQDGALTTRAIDTQPLSDKLAKLLRPIILDGNPCSIQEYGQLDQQVGIEFASALSAVLREHDLTAEEITAHGSHGITLWHEPDDALPYTLQIGDPNQMVARSGITTVADLRRRDMAEGGQGAPLACGFHQAYFASKNNVHVVLNMGGIANITVLSPGQDALGYDTGPANGLMDAWHQQHRNAPFDADGNWAQSGSVDHELLNAMLQDPYFDRPAPKSTGKEHFNLAWLTRFERVNALAPIDVQRTLLELTARSISEAIKQHQATLCAGCGGGINNTALMRRLKELLGSIDLTTTEHFGVNPDFVEAIAFAWLAQQTLLGQSGNLPSVTGARRAAVLGGIYQA